ncbi:cell wall-active antibiotics response protein LiaF [Paenibacillus sp. SI8]|uniref:cell wall-active antibiotics response protein LiaF n=1 Tax=unclassified Paenibacillus TaxID=185978 RepID=UPI0034670D0A
MNPHIFQRIIWGLVLVTVGVFFLLDQTGLIEFDIGYMFSTYWPAILIIYGLISFVSMGKHGWGGSVWGLLLCAVGTIFLLKNLNLTQLSIGEMFQYLGPVALILFGLSVIFKPRRKETKNWDAYKETRDQMKYQVKEAKYQARAARHEARSERKGKYRNSWDHQSWGEKATTEVRKDIPNEPKRELSEEEKAVLKDIHGEFAEKLHNGAEWESIDHRTEKAETPRTPPHGNQHRYDDFVRNYDSGNVLHRHGFIGDVHLGQEPWELKPVQISHFIGDSVIDLTRASIPLGETPIHVTAFIGDVKIFIPNDIDVEVRVIASSFIGDMKVLDRRESGLLRSLRTQSSHYEEADRKLIVTTSMFIGDITVKRIG